MYYKKYEGENVYLSPIDPEDYKTFAKWMSDETLTSGLGNARDLITELGEKEWLENNAKKGTYNFAVVRKEDDKLLGTYGLEVKDEVSRRFHIGGFIGEKENRNKGYGTEALKLVSMFAFELLNAESLYSGIYDFNEASLKSAKKAGYIVAGKYRDSYYYNGKFWDEYCIEMTKTDYNKYRAEVSE